MASEIPEVIIRFGSHAEKEYILKLAPFLDGLIVGANLLQSTPGATASLLVKIKGKDTRFYIDPMTYAYGAYIDPKETGKVRTDLDWIKSDQTRKNSEEKKVTVRDFKRSYRSLGERIGLPLSEAIKTNQALSPITFTDEAQQIQFCRSVFEYQRNCISEVFASDPQLQELQDYVPQPAAVFAPYFYIEPTQTQEWLALNLRLIEQTTGLGLDTPVHAILCADQEHLQNADLRKQLLNSIPKLGVGGIWLWFSRFFEETASQAMLQEYRDLVIGLSAHVEVYAMHGGFFSLSLSKYGMRGVSHGVGYGEQKDVVPIIGQSTPTVRYYLPPLAKRLGVPDIELALNALGIKSPKDFHKRVCDCAVCKGVVSSSLDEFSAFGKMHYSREDSKRKAQTPAAAKRCRYHFLLCRLRERNELRQLTLEEVVTRLEDSSRVWGSQQSLSSDANHLGTWLEVLKTSDSTPTNTTPD